MHNLRPVITLLNSIASNQALANTCTNTCARQLSRVAGSAVGRLSAGANFNMQSHTEKVKVSGDNRLESLRIPSSCIHSQAGKGRTVKLDHIAIAVGDLQKAIERFCEDLGLELEHQESVPNAQTNTAFLPIENTAIELIEPMDGKGPVQKYLDKKGGGLHHLCFRSSDIVADRDRLKEKGYKFISEEPKPGAHGTKVLWIHPKSTEGVLIELAQHPENH